MHKHILFQNLHSMNDFPGRYRWDMKYHYPELVRRFGPWMARFESYLSVPPPPDKYPEVIKYGYFNYRLTVGWWREPTGMPNGTLNFTPTRYDRRSCWCYVPWVATEDFFGSEVMPEEKTILRWVTIFKYPEGVSREQGDDWYINVHAKEVIKQPGLTRFFSYKALDIPGPLPGFKPNTGCIIDAPESKHTADVSPWLRVSEQWYENFNGWHKSIIESPPKYTKPSWAKYNEYPFLEPYVDFCSIFVLELPTNDMFRDYSQVAFTL